MTKAAEVALCWAFALSCLDRIPAAEQLPGRAGLFLAALALGVAVLAEWRYFFALLRRPNRLQIACFVLVGAALVSAVFAQQQRPALWVALRLVALLCFAALILRAGVSIRPRLSTVAGGLIAAHLLFAVAGLVIPSARLLFFDALAHQNLGQMPRFVGLSSSPFGAGFFLLCCAGLARHQALRIAGLSLCFLTFSAVSLTLPILLIWKLPRPRLHLALGAANAAVLLAILWYHPLSLSIGDQRIELSQLHANYGAKGAAHMPQRTLGVGALELTYHPTAYRILIGAAFRCFKRAPLLGIGGRNAEFACRAPSMNTLGNWQSGRRLHNQYAELFAEHGTLGVLALVALLLALRQRYRWSPQRSGQSATVVACLLAGVAATVLWQFAAMALFASCLEQRNSTLDSPAPQT